MRSKRIGESRLTSLLHGLVALLLCLPALGADALWSNVDEQALRTTAGERLIVPQRYRTVALDLERLKLQLAEAPARHDSAKPVFVELPLPNGEMMTLEIVDAPIMAPGLAARHPQIRSFRGVGVDRDDVSARLGWTGKGFHAIVFTDGDTYYIDPYSRNDTANYISYRKRDFADNEESFSCEVHGEHKPLHAAGSDSNRSTALNGTVHKTYRLAMAANYEYTQFHSGPLPTLASKQAAIDAIVITMNRV
ncbi:MAG: hypothetical protein HKN49_09420, partial [Gammaproteobacteria bacterium]|nr:hypothetical protein [Gammaproteobacteria bacterium]